MNRLPIDDSDRAAIRANVHRARRAYRAFHRMIRDDAGSLNPLQQRVADAHLSTLAREKVAAENEAEDYGVEV